jgi:hypothetical protein
MSTRYRYEATRSMIIPSKKIRHLKGYVRPRCSERYQF